jgi:hypothetical protein
VDLIIGAMASSMRFLDAVGEKDRSAVDIAAADGKTRLNQARAAFMRWSEAYHPAKMRSKYLIQLSVYGAGLRRMYWGVFMVFSVARVIGNPRDEDEFNFLLAAAAQGKRVYDDNLSFIEIAGDAGAGYMIQVSEASKRLEADYEILVAMMEDVTRIISENGLT